MFQSEETFTVPSVLALDGRGSLESMLARMALAKTTLIVEDAVRFEIADSAVSAAITSSKPQNISDAPLAPSRRGTP